MQGDTESSAVPVLTSSSTIKNNPAKNIILELLESTGIEINGNQPWDIHVHNEGFYQRVLEAGSLGLGESYMDGWWDCPALEEFFARILRVQLDQKIKGNWVMLARILWQKCQYLVLNPQSKGRAFMVGQRHYDVGNDLYQLMLDPSMSYTCAYWKEAKTLAEAQTAKLELVCQKLQLQKGMRLLDIGCGFGGMARYAAEHYGVEVLGLTISKEQQRLASERCAHLPIEIRLQDYRELDEKFDRIVSIGMFEHVGPKNYDAYMRVAAQCLNDEDDLFLLHTIGGNISTSEANPWICKYIFPNGVIPSITQVGKSIEGKFVMEDWHNFGVDYYKTLMSWFDNFTKNFAQLKDKYDQRFYRMWKYYLLSCAGAFYARDIQLWQIVLSKKGVLEGYVAPR
jgi:cyclopropane-fatty-acyl-phospholipid synthase